ncbi:hypothetical protein CONPUDRAFT_166583 [Coniophora puteana RWD-64-598 SS2]|uniref:F-box domain-containing protein n=1 Tax=Coniophora puteana (strain RWD-64-598) TaxID=741705 RepID=A0A5M3ML05_CONPW|nr:uncharacterized protein CONPUDRAFT_166583 [Coniophora puteana RWD-64-598 SS2]EIW79912.1 hypothetical protein CONPUDRAFT_166583 [Coniophora puteana RWD-64-598 SS2]
MHGCLRVPELTTYIFSFLGTSDKGTLSGLARTCKAFEDTALDGLYYELPCLGTFFTCLPRDLWEIRENRLTFNRSMLMKDWTILKKHIHRVREVQCDRVVVDAEALSAVSFFCSEHLFPNLKALVVNSPEFPMASLPLLCSPHVLDADLNELPHKLFHALLLLGRACPFLKSLYVTPLLDEELQEETWAEFATVLSDAVTSFSHLQRFYIFVPSTPGILFDTILPLSQLPSLKSLVVTLLEEQVDPIPAHQVERIQFPALRFVEIATTGPALVSSFMRMLCFDGLSRVSLFKATLQEFPEKDELPKMIETVATRLCKERMRSIRFHQEIDIDEPVKHSSGPLDACMFSPLYKFSQLEELAFDLLGGPRIDDASLEELSLAFPKLQHLYLNILVGAGEFNGVTLKGLAVLLLNCPFLDSLSLVTNVTPEANAEFDASPIDVRNTHIMNLEVMNSPIEDSGYAARHLIRMLPNLREVVYDSPFEASATDDDILERWSEVDSFLREHAAAKNPFTTLK